MRSLLLVSPTERQRAFFDCWTRKEALIKALGYGLSLPLDQFDVTLCPGQAAGLLQTLWDPNANWSLRELNVGAGYAASVAVEGHNWQPKF